jgi:cytochrome c-type biogenesis protein CcmH
MGGLRAIVTRMLVVGVAALALAGTPVAHAEEPPRASDLEAELVCPTCETTLDQSDAPVARRMKAYLRQRIAEGATAAQIKAELVDEFGPGVLAEPPKRGFDLLAWALPLGGISLGALGVGALAWGWSRQRRDGAPAEPALDAELARRVDDELARFDR